MHKKEDDLALKDKQSVPKGRRPLPILNTNFYNKGNKFTNALGDYARIATFLKHPYFIRVLPTFRNIYIVPEILIIFPES